VWLLTSAKLGGEHLLMVSMRSTERKREKERAEAEAEHFNSAKVTLSHSKLNSCNKNANSSLRVAHKHILVHIVYRYVD